MVPGGLVVVDKPGGMTSHDVVSRMRRIAHTRRVGHAGTLDPMATGVLVLGVERATKLLGHLALSTKAYSATIRLGASTVTDDAEGEPTGGAPADGLSADDVRAAMGPLTGDIAQVPSAVSAIKVDGKRSYARVRSGEAVDLAARAVTVSRFALLECGPAGAGCLDARVEVECTTGTYVRALARDLGAALGVGGHLTALRRTRVGPFTLGHAATLDALADSADPIALPLGDAVALCFPRRDLTDDEAARLANGGRLEPVGLPSPYGGFAPDGHVVALLQETDGLARPLVVLAPA
ncbi:MAG: tRNA pseudouridine(55) synthase TruB [Geodermatophilaceae bacterium]|nr:tRNA pseudouridine(55) synthase TruB [Geodermatophilaceae bacterium]